jgi:hypothetical protein
MLLPGTWRRDAEGAVAGDADKIDRHALVTRHNPVVWALDPFAALTVGNGSFAFTADVTGLQTFPEEYLKEFPLCTCAAWAWHTMPAPAGVNPADLKFKNFNAHGRQVGYATSSTGQQPLFDWLRQNPHRLHLGQIGLMMGTPDAVAVSKDISGITQSLDLWAGIITSHFQFAGRPVTVQTCCHPDQDALAVRIESRLIDDGRLAVRLSFPYGSPEVDMADWTSPQSHSTECKIGDHSAEFQRVLDKDSYSASLAWTGGKLEKPAVHEFLLRGKGDMLEFVIRFSPQPNPAAMPTFDETLQASKSHWQTFWTEGAAVDLSGSTDPRAEELERRIVLSQYNTALHCAGPMPPQETGLLFNSWYGKSHLEMHWLHGVHFAAWGRFPLFGRSLDYYHRILPVARATAVRQGYDGVRWPKMVGPEGHDSPSPIGPLLIWQQPHPIYYAELCHRQNPGRETLDKWSEIVFETARFMASYAVLMGDRYVLGPPMKTVSENSDTLTTINPTFELEYWRFGLGIAQQWRQRLGLPPDPKWADMLARLSPLPIQDGLYLMQEGMTDTYTKWNWEHPALLGALGVQRGDGVDLPTMRATLKKVMEVWDWDRCWGWDFPMAAMTAARLGEGELAVRAIMIESVKNRYLPNGHVYQRPGLTAYLPANGGLLAAVAMMVLNPGGFPNDGKWKVRAEGLSLLL